jgi:uncharacterized protein YtpQ (UPF0354 family)
MALFEHPLQLFTLEHPENWGVQYQEETGGVIFTHTALPDACALSFTPVAVTGGESSLIEQLLEIARRLEVSIPADAVETGEFGQVRFAYAEGSRERPDLMGTRLRFWVVRHGPLALHVAQLGPGVQHDGQRAAADAALQSLAFPEIMPPTPEEFRERVLETIGREYPNVRASRHGEWALSLTDAQGEPISTVGLENVYRSCLLNAESTGALIRDYLDQILDSWAEGGSYDRYGAVRDRLMPVLKPEEWVQEVPGGQELVKVEFAPGLVMCFAIDEPTRMAYVTGEMLEKWGVPLERVQEVAQDNLAARDSSLEVMVMNDGDNRPCAMIVNTQDGYDASRLTVPGVRDLFAEELGDEYLVGLPNRDFLIAFSLRDGEMSAGIVRQIKHDYQRMNHPITATVYRVRPDTIEPTEL